MTMIKGTHLDVKFNRVVDGDTVKVFLPGAEKDESLRILSLDTEESHAGGGKPVTPWGKAAKKRAEEFFKDADTVTMEFPGNDDLATSLQKHRGNFGRLLVYVYRDGVDFQETMIREGFSPYFVKYGRAQFAGHHQRFTKAEQDAQRQRIGMWDQIAVNGSELRNYAALGTWWELRGTIIDEYRKVKAIDDSLLNPRLDYATIVAKARDQEHATVFTEVRSITRVGGSSGLIGIGSIEQAFSLFIPDIDSPEGQEIVNLLETRYISSGDDHPKRSYAYVTGQLSTFRDRPQIVLTSADQITDSIVARKDSASPAAIVIASLLPNPEGPDQGFEHVTLRNAGTASVNLQGWSMQDLAGNQVDLAGAIDAGQEKKIVLQGDQMPLNNTGDEVVLLDPDGKIQNTASYSASDVVAGQPIQFS
jgi:micrococcal nuclease